jgi:hypothetical protein
MPQQNRYNAVDEHDFVLAGYVTFFEPPLQQPPRSSNRFGATEWQLRF